MQGNKIVVGVFGYLDDTLQAIRRVKEMDFEMKVYSPVPSHEIEELTLPGKSPVRRVTLTGAVTGIISGFSLAILCAMDYPLRVSAKDVVSVPGFVVIGYECTILFGAIFTLLALLHFCRIPAIFRKPGYDPRFSDDKYGVVVGCNSADIDNLKAELSKAGALEVRVEDGL